MDIDFRQSRLLHLLLMMSMLLAGCNQLSFTRPASSQNESSSQANGSNNWVKPTPPKTSDDETSVRLQTESTPSTRQHIVEIGDEQYINEKKTKSSTGNPVDQAEGITLNFQGTDIREFVKAILNDVLEQTFIIDPQVSGTVTIETATGLRKEQLYSILEEVLAMNGAAMIKKGGLYYILPKGKVIGGNISPSTADVSEQDGYGVRIIPLQYIAAIEMQKILEPFVTEAGQVNIDVKRNLIIAKGTPKELATLQETIDIFDVDWLRGMSVGLYPLEHVDPKTLKTELDGILGTEESQELLGGLVRTLPIERLNSVLLISSTSHALREAELWLYRLDRPGDQVGQRLYVYNVQNAKATELAEILGHIFGTGSTDVARKAPELAPGLKPVEITSSEEGDSTRESPSIETSQPRITTAGDDSVSISSLSDIEIIADDTRNALVILATGQDYRMIESAIRKLDIIPLQVLIEASIIEVTLNDDLRYGVEWFFKNGIGDDKEGGGLLDVGEAGIGALVPGFSYTVIDSAAGVRLAINAIESKTDINVISSPSLMVLDNEEAMINVGDQIPIPTRQSVSNIDPDAPTVNEIEFRDTGVSLTVKPRVNESGLVTMEVAQEVSDALVTTTSGLDAPTIRQRQIESTVAVNSGETIVLGGLIRDSENQSKDGIPLLHRIPVLGNLFGRTSNEGRRTELLVLLTPKVVRDRDGARQITDEFRKKLRGLKPFDPHTYEQSGS